MMLKPCPFCGGEGYLNREQNYYGHFPHIVQCRECEARTGGDRTEELAAQTWNCRVEKKEAKNG